METCNQIILAKLGFRVNWQENLLQSDESGRETLSTQDYSVSWWNRESCGIQPINEWMERRWREWEERVTIMYAETLV